MFFSVKIKFGVHVFFSVLVDWMECDVLCTLSALPVISYTNLLRDVASVAPLEKAIDPTSVKDRDSSSVAFCTLLTNQKGAPASMKQNTIYDRLS